VAVSLNHKDILSEPRLPALASSAPMVIAGVTMLASVGGGLYWAVAQVVLGFSIAIYYTWILLIEILR
jgi:hypothetical protein